MSEFNYKVEREITDFEAHLWNIQPKWVTSPDNLTINEPPTEPPLYNHSDIDEEAESFYSSNERNYFVKKFKKQIEKENTWGSYHYDGGTITLKPLEKKMFWHARELVKEYFLKLDPVWSYYDIEKDPEAYDALMVLLKDWIVSGQSVAAVNVAKKTLHGVALGLYNDGDYISKKIAQCQAFHPKVARLLNLRRYFEKRVTTSLPMWDKCFYEIHMLCTDNAYPFPNVLLKGMIKATLNIARQLNAAFVFGLTTQKIHETAFQLSGFKKFTESPIYSWIDEGEHMNATFISLEDCDKIGVFTKKVKRDPKKKWEYYGKY